MCKAFDVPTKHFLNDYEGCVFFTQFLDGVDLRARVVVGIVGAEHPVNVVEQVAPCGLVLFRVPLLQENEVVNVEVNVAEAGLLDGVW